MEKERINKYLAACGICSRREADRLIDAGEVKVNGYIADKGILVGDDDEIVVKGKITSGKNKKVVLAYYKPKGVTCSEKDEHADVIITDALNYPVRVTYAGRLDRDSHGLILMTNDGMLINSLMKASNFHEKEYVVKVDKEVTDEFLNNMSKGVFLKELGIKTRKCTVKKLSKYTFSIILTQGVNRQIRRMCKVFNYTVLDLKRIRIANIELANLKSGEYREISGIELQALLNQLNKNSI